MSLTATTRENFIDCLCETLRLLCRILQKSEETQTPNFRDAFTCHLYMLYSAMFSTESHMADASNSHKPCESLLQRRTVCTETMLQVAKVMATHKNVLWQRGVADEAVVLVPCRTAYFLLERCSGVQARKALCAELAMEIIAKTVESDNAPMTPISASLMDLMHSHEHMSPLVAEICGTLCESDKLAVELLREYGRLDGAVAQAKANGIKNVAPFICDLSNLQPEWVYRQLPHILPHFQSEAYNLRSALVNALTSILEFMQSLECQQASDANSAAQSNSLGNGHSKAQGQFLDILFERVYDTNSFTRSTVLKAWVTLIAKRMVPKDRIIQLTRVAMDRLNDKTVLVRKQAMQVRI